MKRKADDIEADSSNVAEGAANSTRAESTASGTGRRSARLASKASLTPGPLIAQSDADSDVELPRKRARRKGKSSRKPPSKSLVRRKGSKVGKLAGLLEMPFDVFCEIAKFLSPHDVLNMARSFKSLRATLTSRDSRPIWRAARNAIGLPDCPSDLSEVQFADLLFGKRCYVCGAPRTQQVYIALRLRLCMICTQKSLASRYRLEVQFPSGEELRLLLPGDQGNHWDRLYRLDEAVSVRDRLELLASNPEERTNFIEDRKKKVVSIETHARKVRDWLEIETLKKEDAKLKIIDERIRMLMEKLKSKGYTHVDLCPSLDTPSLRSEWFKLTRAAKPLTDRIWRNMEPKLENIISKRREIRRSLGELSPTPFHELDCECDNCLEDYDTDDSYCGCTDCMAVDSDDYDFDPHDFDFYDSDDGSVPELIFLW